MKFHYGWRILAGLIIFLGLIATPFLMGASKAYETPEDKLPTEAEMKAMGYDVYSCVESKEFMRSSHMQLLDEWRDAALRDGHRYYVSKATGQTYMISLQNTCMKCHKSKAEFCDKCHNAAAVTPYCWDCHYTPEELKNEAQ